jgi:hypothetical protein
VTHIVNDIRKVVDKVNVLGIRRYRGFQHVKYMSGHFVEVNNRINKLDSTAKRLETFPMIALRLDTTPRAEDGLMKYDLNVVIMHTTKADLNAEQRIEENFAKVLTPIYKLFMEATATVRLFCWTGDSIPHVPIDRPYMKGVSNDNTFSEHVDAIEIQNLRLSKHLNQC